MLCICFVVLLLVLAFGSFRVVCFGRKKSCVSVLMVVDEKQDVEK
jgi:hypothetical protein